MSHLKFWPNFKFVDIQIPPEICNSTFPYFFFKFFNLPLNVLLPDGHVLRVEVDEDDVERVAKSLPHLFVILCLQSVVVLHTPINCLCLKGNIGMIEMLCVEYI